MKKKNELTVAEKRGIVIAITAGVAVIMLLIGTLIGGAVTGQQLKEERRTVDRLEEQNDQYKTDLEALQEDYDSLKRESNSSNSKNAAEVKELQEQINQLEAERSNFAEGSAEDFVLKIFYEDGNLYHVEEENWTFYSDTGLQNPIGNDFQIVSSVVKREEVKDGGITHYIYIVRSENGLVYSEDKPRLRKVE